MSIIAKTIVTSPPSSLDEDSSHDVVCPSDNDAATIVPCHREQQHQHVDDNDDNRLTQAKHVDVRICCTLEMKFIWYAPYTLCPLYILY